ncbi:hypothetical protein [Thiolapillus sp.]
MPHPFLKIAAVAATALTLTACVDEYYNQDGSNNNDGYYSPGGGSYYPRPGYYPPPHEYYPPHDYDAPRKELVKNCQGKIREKVRKRIGYNAKIDWGKTDIYNNARHEATINGRGKARNNGKKHQLYYSCIMNREDAFVRNARIELDNDDHNTGGTDWNREATRACHARIREKARRNIHQQFSLDFTRQRVTTPAERRRHVTGEALVRVSRGSGKIAYDCKTHVNPLRLESASYRWTKPLPSANNGNDHAEAKRQCEKHLNDKLRAKGYQYIGIVSESVRNLKGNKRQVMLRIKAMKSNKRVVETWECRVNPRSGKLFKLHRTGY